jgi:glutamate/tyrosine decarboxylase-like PLP-dependent enzyme
MDIGKPPVVPIPHMDFPKMVYLHPQDKTREHLTKIVNNATELAESMAKGWRKQPHVPVTNEPEIPAGYEFEAEPEAKRNRKGTEAL